MISLEFLRKLFSRAQKSPDKFLSLEKRIGYRFHTPELLTTAFTHRSIYPEPDKNYERLEFLGDAVIDTIISKALMEDYPIGDEGLLTQKRSALVKKEFLANMGNLLRLLDYLLIENSVDMSVEKIAIKQQANLFESLIGALYLDGGIGPCEQVILQTVWKHRREAWKSTNHKGHLIEYCHSRSLESPRFIVAKVSGPDHQRMFEIYVKIGSREFRPGLGSNKKTAEQSAAQIALEKLQKSVRV
ncbi:MAG: ribonuclease III [FCB group bacterium]|nr:ribonuclease III [FCB group bacterium]